MARLRASWRTSLPVVQQPRNPQSESIARTPYQTLNFRAPVRIGDTVHVQVEVVELIPDRHRARLACTCRVGEEVVLDGEALIKVRLLRTAHPYSRQEV